MSLNEAECRSAPLNVKLYLDWRQIFDNSVTRFVPTTRFLAFHRFLPTQTFLKKIKQPLGAPAFDLQKRVLAWRHLSSVPKKAIPLAVGPTILLKNGKPALVQYRGAWNREAHSLAFCVVGWRVEQHSPARLFCGNLLE